MGSPTATLLAAKVGLAFWMHAVTGEPGRIPEVRPPIDPDQTRQGLDVPAHRRSDGAREARMTPRGKPFRRGCTQPAAHPAAPSQNGRRLPLAVRGANAKAGARPTPSRAWRRAGPTKGGAVRNRIALATAVAVNVLLSAVFASLITSGWAPRRRRPATRRSAPQGAEPRPAHQRHVDVVLPGPQGRTDGELRQRCGAAQQATSTTTSPGSRAQRRRTPSRPPGCRRPSAKRGVATTPTPATSASSSGTTSMAIRPPAVRRLSVQLAWEAAHGQGPPDAPGECHGY